MTVSNACDSHESSGLSAALIPPAAALECERTGWTLLMIATVAPALAAARAARCPASPAPMMRTSWDGMGWKPTSRFAAEGACPGPGTTQGTAYDARRMATSEPVRVMVVDDQADVRFLIARAARRAPGPGGRRARPTAPTRRSPRWPRGARTSRSWTPACRSRTASSSRRCCWPRAPGLRVAILTTIVDEVVERRAREAGAAACLSKDDLDALPDAIRRLAAG